MAAIHPIVPDRYENLKRKASDDLETIVAPVHDALALIDNVYARMRTAGRGGFLVLRGESGAGKSTFLHTLSFFRDDIKTLSVRGDQDVRSYFYLHLQSRAALQFMFSKNVRLLKSTLIANSKIGFMQ